MSLSSLQSWMLRNVATRAFDSHHRFRPANDEFPAKFHASVTCAFADKWHSVILRLLRASGCDDVSFRRLLFSSPSSTHNNCFSSLSRVIGPTLFVRARHSRSTDFSDSVESSFVLFPCASARIKIATGTGYRKRRQGVSSEQRNGPSCTLEHPSFVSARRGRIVSELN